MKDNSNFEIGKTLTEKVFCKKCNEDTAHFFFSKKISTVDFTTETVTIKIQCSKCNKISPLNENKKSRHSTKSYISSPDISYLQTWEAEVKGQLGITYTQDGFFNKEQIVNHPKFGEMKCLSIRLGKVEFLTSLGVKLLVSKNT